jgi:rubrerythrin
MHDIGELLAHALELEHEAALRYQQLADSLALHHNHTVATLFRQLAVHSEAIAANVGERARGVALPRIAPWAFKWNCPDSPKAADCLDERIGYQMSAVQALGLALHNETRGHAFYAGIAAAAADAEVRLLAAELAADQREHLNWLRARLADTDDADGPAAEDLDPPNVPE